MPEATYDLRDWLPSGERGKIPDEASPAVTPLDGPIFRDLPIDSEHGAYPVVILIHGTSSLRIASGSSLVHWARHGFVVLAADHPGLMLHDQLAGGCGIEPTGPQDIPADVSAEIEALEAASGELAFLGDRADTGRIAINGHSQGGCVAAALTNLPHVQLVMPFSGSFPTQPSADLQSIRPGATDRQLGMPSRLDLFS